MNKMNLQLLSAMAEVYKWTTDTALFRQEEISWREKKTSLIQLWGRVEGAATQPHRRNMHPPSKLPRE